ncbi:MAG: iron ABC transporter permease [Flavobacteriaceae bacterium]|nr:iron ABC transporter permease [Flavobacteriaceae bacterium]
MSLKYIKQIVFIAIMFLLLLAVALLSLSVGEINFSPNELLTIFKNQSGIEYTIINNIRLPRIILGIAVGGALSLSGVILQGVYRNPLVEPFTLGISGGASLGVAITIIFNLNLIIGIYMLPFAGFIGAVVTTFLVYILAVRKNYYNINRMLLIGVMISFMTSSVMMFLMSTTTAENLHSIIFWIMGSLDEPNITLVKVVFYVSLIGLLLSYLMANPLNALRLGESKAKHLGVNTTFTIRALFILASILTGISVSVAGVIGFVGLIIPHLMRMVIGSDFRLLLISSFLGGSIFILISDIIARTIIAPNELPIGVITGMIGGLVFIIVMSRSKMKV